jgi:hypothetical protein
MNINARNTHRAGALARTLAFASLLGWGACAQAQDADGGAPGDWLSRYSGARSVGFGGAFVASANEPMGVVWNPAGLSQLFQNELHVETARLFESTNISAVSFAAPARRIPSFGITMVMLSSGEFERTNELNESLGTFEEADMAFLLTASKNLSTNMAVGTNLKVVRQSLEEFSAAGVGFDVGMMYDISPALRLGASLLNIGGPSLALRDTDEKFPFEFRGGLALRVFKGRGVITAEFDQRSGPGTSLHGGSEIWVHRAMALRLGYNERYATGGFSYRVAPGMRFDYGVADHALGLTHRVGLSYRFGGFFASSVADPPVFSPMGQQSVTKFQLEAHTKSNAREWKLDIINSSNQIVRSFGGRGLPPAHVMWDGKNAVGLPLADGIYRYQIVVRDDQGREIQSRVRSVEITTSGPQGSVPVFVEP